jgi:TRAP-type C4-dicarboxylate transport system permease small subunit
MVHIPSSQVGVVISKTLILIIGGLITYYSYQAYQRTGTAQHRWLMFGFGTVTVGAILGGALDIVVGTYLAQNQIYTSVLVSSSLTAAGLGIILYSLYVR